MRARPDNAPASKIRWVAVAAAIVALVIGGGHVVAWVAGAMTRAPSATIIMKTNAGLGLFMSGLALLLVLRRGARARWPPRTVAAFVLLVGLATLSEHLVGWNLHIDELLASEAAGAAGTTSPNRMGPPAALSFVLLGIAFLLAARAERRRALHEPFALVVALLGLLSIIGYLYDASELYAIARTTGIAWPTALSLLVLAVGLLCARPREGLMARVTADDSGGEIVRAILAPTILLPIVFGWARLAGERRGWFDAPMGTGVMMLLFIVTFSALLLFAGRRVSVASAGRRKSEQALRESEDFLSFALTTARTGAWDLDLANHTAHRSLEHDRIFGYEELLPQWTYEMFLQHVVPEDRDAVDRQFRTAVERRSDWNFECRIVRRDGETRWIWAAGRHRLEPNGQSLRMAGVVQDITERKQAQEALAERAVEQQALVDALKKGDQQFRALIENVAAGVALIDETGRFALYNRQFLAMFGLAADSGIRNVNDQDWSAWQVFDEHGRLLDLDEHPVRKAVLTGKSVRDQLVKVRLPRGGTEIWMLVSAEPLYGADGRLERIICTYSDITDRRRAEEALAEKAAELGAVLDSLQDAVFVCDASGAVVRINPAARDLYPVDVTGKSADALTDLRIRRPDGSDMPSSEFPSRRALSGERVSRQQYLFAGKDGDRVGEASATPLVVGDKVVGAVAIARDITERKRVEEALRRSEEKFAKAFHGNTAAMSITRARDGLYLEVNDRFAHVTGFARAQAVGRTSGELNIWKDPRDREAFVKALRERGTVQNVECRFVRPSGEEWIALVSSQVSQIEGEPVLVSSFADITEGKRAEQALRESEEALRQANARLAEADRRKDEFLAVLSHELRNPLAPIRAALYILDRAVPGSEDANRARTVIARQSAQLARLVDDLLDVTRITRGKIHLHRERLDVTDLVQRTAEDHRHLFTTRGVALAVNVPGEQLWVNGDAHRLAQVVGNLLHNASKFTERGGRTAISVSKEEPSRSAVITVSDTGIGISASAQQHLFEPFMQVDETLDRARGGLGLGLSLVKSLTEMHEGTVSVWSEGVGHGTRFTIRLPLQEPPAAAAVAPADARRRSRRILIIEDNVDAAETLRDALALAGHDVQVAFDGTEGLDVARRFAPEIVLCDIGLPGMSGYRVAQALRADDRMRSVYLVALTGYALPEDVAKARAAGFDRHIAKPPDPVELEAALAALDDSRGA